MKQQAVMEMLLLGPFPGFAWKKQKQLMLREGGVMLVLHSFHPLHGPP